ncbi:protein-disulfide reductase DsbD family protein [Aliidiomarina quisquiliarum]|uniref:protein-disulfide reductase DsbD family protein n=1 Tax=Aliidiomarina quisquiliarum TaxID=2938947 RepID=UPI00208F7774|nr:thioredoxin family protein [Aliidiomarina quisquiliarum]MCO4320392.1 thioredoxin family protein [Aliidiomarina quisquiliarum]
MHRYFNTVFIRLSAVVALPLLLLVLLSSPLHAATQNSGFANAASAWQQQPLVQTRLLSEFATITPGHIYTLAIEVETDPEWHTLWLNSDAGFTVQWQGPEGSYFDDVQWPTVQRFNSPASYGFTGHHYLLTDFSIPSDYADTLLATSEFAITATLTANIQLQLCHNTAATECVNNNAQHSVTLNIAPRSSEQSARPALEQHRRHFLAARQQLPELAPWQARFDIQGEQLTLLIESAAAVSLVQAASTTSAPYAYMGAPGLITNNAAQTIEYIDDIVVIRQPLQSQAAGFTPKHLPESFPVQLALANSSTNAKQHSLEFLAVAVQPEPASSGADYQTELSLLVVFVFAFLGGLILNLMPCVFPVLSLKAMALTNSGSSHKQRSESLWYTAGVVLSFLLIAGTLIALRAAGQALGWGFQLQSPWLIGALVFLFVAIGLNLTGAFQIGTRLMGVGQNSNLLNPEGGAQSSFATGVLAVLIASPCTAPFMGVALGYAITQPPALALLIFAVLGLGLAAPFLLFGFVPGFAKILPKPGLWMETFKQWMAVPMYITTVWLLWVFGRQTGIDSLTLLLLAVVLFATALWWWGKQQLQATRSRVQGSIVLVFLALAGLSFFQALSMQTTANTQPSLATTDNQWSQAKLDSLRQQQPVFVNMTADWCITCLANERVALHTDATQALFAEYNIAQLKGDWTMQDPDITEYLAKFGRNGVPLYVLYFPGQEPQVLPQILTNSTIRDYVEAGLNK